MKKLFWVLAWLGIPLGALATPTLTPTCQATRTPACQNQFTNTPTPTVTCNTSWTPICGNQFSPTPTKTPTPTPIGTRSTKTFTPTRTFTSTPTSTPTNTPTPNSTQEIPFYNPTNTANLYDSGIVLDTGSGMLSSNNALGLNSTGGNMTIFGSSFIDLGTHHLGDKTMVEIARNSFSFDPSNSGMAFFMGTNKIQNMGEPASSTDGATKNYADTHIQGSVVTPVPTFSLYNGPMTVLAGIAATPVAVQVKNGLIIVQTPIP